MPGVDPVAKITLTVECAPGQELTIIQWLGGVVKQAGVYCVDLNSPVVDLPVPSIDVVEPGIEVPNAPAIEHPAADPAISEPTFPAPVESAEKVSTLGDTVGEPLLQ
jgi:hypothetical protein